MYVLVQYENKYTGGYDGKSYAYKTELPLNEGDIVLAPTWKGDAPAKVAAVNIPASSIAESVLPKIKDIVSYAEEDADA